MGAEKSPICLHTSKKNRGKVPKRIHKAEREKLKREHLNELFIELAGAIEVTEQNSGKASILGETTRFFKDILDQIKSLKKEKAALLSESHYVTVERNELQDETSTLQNRSSELKSMLKERSVQTNLDLNAPAVESQEPQFPTYFVIPACHNLQVHPQEDSVMGMCMGMGMGMDFGVGNKPVSNVSKPYPRYLSLSDS